MEKLKRNPIPQTTPETRGNDFLCRIFNGEKLMKEQRSLPQSITMDSNDHKKYIVLNPAQSGVDKNWHVTDQDDTCVAACFGFCHDIPSGEPLARRIAACLNAFSGMSVEQITRMGNVLSFLEKHERVIK